MLRFQFHVNHRLILPVVCLLMVLLVCAPAYAAEQDDALAYLQQQGILQGDANGDMRAGAGLTRAELAAILVRMNGGASEMEEAAAIWAGFCYFGDVIQDWQKPYIGYCSVHGLMNGYSSTEFGPGDSVNVLMACTVVLRYMGVSETDWDYNSAYTKAASISIAPAGLTGNITRGEMAVLIYRAMSGGSGSTGGSGTGGTGTGGTTGGGATTTGSNEWGSGAVSATPIEGPKVLDGVAASREDWSQQANPAAFNDVYTREVYNAFRQSIIDRDIILTQSGDGDFNPYYYYAHAVKGDVKMQILGD